MMTEIIRQYDFNLAYAKVLVEDLTEEQMTVRPCSGLENHPAFTLGHLVTASAMMLEDLGGIYQVPEGWTELFVRKGPGDPRLPEVEAGKYPAKKKLIEEFSLQHEQLRRFISGCNPSTLSGSFTWRFSGYFPTLLDLLVFMCINHEAMHLGQLAAWRRAMNLPSALGRM